MSEIYSINYEGYKVWIDQSHIKSLYIEDEWIGEIERGNFLDFDKSKLNLFENPSGLLEELQERDYIYWHGDNYTYSKIENIYGVIISRKILQEFDRLIDEGDCEYVDNKRVALEDNEEQTKLYRENMKNGCCGFVDEEVIIEGKKYWIGFNYGH